MKAKLLPIAHSRSTCLFCLLVFSNSELYRRYLYSSVLSRGYIFAIMSISSLVFVCLAIYSRLTQVISVTGSLSTGLVLRLSPPQFMQSCRAADVSEPRIGAR